MLNKLIFPLPDFTFKDEKSFTAWLGRMIHDNGGAWHKISDQSIDSKPCDSTLGYKGICGWMEIKAGKEKKFVNVNKLLRPNQTFGLRRYQANGGLSLVVYYSRTHHKYRVMEYNPVLNLDLKF